MFDLGLDSWLFTGAVIGVSGTLHFFFGAMVLLAQLSVPSPAGLERRVALIWFLPLIGPVVGLMLLANELCERRRRRIVDHPAIQSREMAEVDWVRAVEWFEEDLRRRGVR